MADPDTDGSGTETATDRTDRFDGEPETSQEAVDDDDVSMAELRAAVEEKYDFEDFTAEDMASMSGEEWEAAFDAESWITGSALLDRVEADLQNRIASRDVFAVVERITEGGEERLLAYSDEGYSIVYPDGTVEGRGTVLRDVKPVVALCSMEEYEVSEPPEGDILPDPESVPEGGSELGNQLMLAVAGVQLVAGLFLLLSPVIVEPLLELFCQPTTETGVYNCAIGLPGSTTTIAMQSPGRAIVLTTIVGLGFLVISGLLFVVVANARLSDRFRAEEYRERLRATGVGTDERPDFLPIDEETGQLEALENGGAGEEPQN
ncbi:MAG: hypothetical protein ABEI76_01625 [Halobacteriales archaeon]